MEWSRLIKDTVALIPGLRTALSNVWNRISVQLNFARFQAVGWWNAQIIGSKTIGDYAGTMSDTCLQLGQWHILPRYFSCSGTADWRLHYTPNIYLMGRKLPSPRPLVGAFLHLFRSRWSPIAPSRAKENRSTIDRPAVNIYCRTGSKLIGVLYICNKKLRKECNLLEMSVG